MVVVSREGKLAVSHVPMSQHWLVLGSACAGIKDSKKRALLTRLAAEFSVSAQRAEPSRIEVLQVPKVLKRPYTVIGANGERREDPYYWLRDDERENPEVLEHLKVGPQSFSTCLKCTKALCILRSGWPQQYKRSCCSSARSARIDLTMHYVKERAHPGQEDCLFCFSLRATGVYCAGRGGVRQAGAG